MPSKKIAVLLIDNCRSAGYIYERALDPDQAQTQPLLTGGTVQYLIIVGDQSFTPRPIARAYIARSRSPHSADKNEDKKRERVGR